MCLLTLRSLSPKFGNQLKPSQRRNSAYTRTGRNVVAYSVSFLVGETMSLWRARRVLEVPIVQDVDSQGRSGRFSSPLNLARGD